MTNRRDVIKAAAAAFLVGPSLLRKPDFSYGPVPTGLNLMKCRFAVFQEPIEVLRAYRTVLYGPLDNQAWAGPKILAVDRAPNQLSILFHMQPLLCQESMAVSGIKFYHPSGEYRTGNDFHGGSVSMMPLDTLNVDFTAHCQT